MAIQGIIARNFLQVVPSYPAVSLNKILLPGARTPHFMKNTLIGSNAKFRCVQGLRGFN
jgi:hypothetical protein